MKQQKFGQGKKARFLTPITGSSCTSTATRARKISSILYENRRVAVSWLDTRLRRKEKERKRERKKERKKERKREKKKDRKREKEIERLKRNVFPCLQKSLRPKRTEKRKK